jgi:hypothetical protein
MHHKDEEPHNEHRTKQPLLENYAKLWGRSGFPVFLAVDGGFVEDPAS